MKKDKLPKKQDYEIREEEHVKRSLTVIENFIKRKYKYYFIKDKYGNNFEYPSTLIHRIDYKQHDKISIDHGFDLGLNVYFLTYNINELEFFKDKKEAEEFVKNYFIHQVDQELKALEYSERIGTLNRLYLPFTLKDNFIKANNIRLPPKLLDFKIAYLIDKANNIRMYNEKEQTEFELQLIELENAKL
jgi:hypothetical protein